MSIDRYGTPGGPLVVALHGAVGNRKTWRPLARVLPRDFELWCPDLPGHGGRRDETFTLEGALDEIEATLALARPRRAILAGDSLGGYLALAAGARGARGLAGIVAGGCTWTMTGAWGVIARASDLPVSAFVALAGERRCEAWLERALARVFRDEDAAEISGAGLSLRSRSDSLRELHGFDALAVARRIRTHVVFVNGERDWPIRRGERGLLAATREAELLIAPGCGHGAGMLAAGTFAKAIATLHARGFVADGRTGRTV